MFSESTSIPSESFKKSMSKSCSLSRGISINTALSLLQKLSTPSNVRGLFKSLLRSMRCVQSQYFLHQNAQILSTTSYVRGLSKRAPSTNGCARSQDLSHQKSSKTNEIKSCSLSLCLLQNHQYRHCICQKGTEKLVMVRGCPFYRQKCAEDT